MYLWSGLQQAVGVDADPSSGKMLASSEDDDAPNDISRCTGAQARAKLERLGLLGGF